MNNLAKARHPPEKNKKVSHHAHGSLFEQKKKGRKGKDDKSKSIDDGQVSRFTHAHDQST